MEAPLIRGFKGAEPPYLICNATTLTNGLIKVLTEVSDAIHTDTYQVPAAKLVTVACPLKLTASFELTIPCEPAIYLSVFCPVNVIGVVPVCKFMQTPAVAPADDEIPRVLVN